MTYQAYLYYSVIIIRNSMFKSLLCEPSVIRKLPIKLVDDEVRLIMTS